jgi:hypothetical protein
MTRLTHPRNRRPSGIATLSATGTEPPRLRNAKAKHCHPDGGRFLADEGSAVAFPGEQEKLPPAMHRVYEVTL